jgi:hypothetical protein
MCLIWYAFQFSQIKSDKLLAGKVFTFFTALPLPKPTGL